MTQTNTYVYDFNNVEQKRTAFLQRWGALKTERSTWQEHWYDIGRFLLPRNGRFFKGNKNQARPENYNRIYDNTGTKANRTLGAGMQSGATPPGRPWFMLSVSDPDLSENHSVRLWLDDVVDRMQRVFARSNTYRAIHQMYEELGAFGTAGSILLPDFKNVIHHYPLTCGEYCLQQDYQGRIISCYREFEKTVGEVVKEFGLENCSRAVQDQWNNRQLEGRVEILHVIEPRSDQERDPNSKHARDMPYKSCYLETGGDDNKILREGGYKRFPVLAPRWSVAGGDVYGHSPGMEALGDIRQLQQEQLRKGQAIDYMVRPPLQVPTSYGQQSGKMFPGGLSYADPGTMLPLNQAGPNGGIRTAFNVDLRLDYLLNDIIDVRERIGSSFHSDIFLMLTGMDNPSMTATEIMARLEEKMVVLGPVVERLHNELLEPLINITFDHMADAGLLPPAPDELAGQDLTVEFVSILAQAQRASGSSAVDRFMGNVLTVAEAKPDILDKVNTDKYVDHYADILGVDNDLIVPDEDVSALREARAAAEAAQAQVEAQREQAAAAKDAATVKTDERNAVADVINSGVQQQ